MDTVPCHGLNFLDLSLLVWTFAPRALDHESQDREDDLPGGVDSPGTAAAQPSVETSECGPAVASGAGQPYVGVVDSCRAWPVAYSTPEPVGAELPSPF